MRPRVSGCDCAKPVAVHVEQVVVDASAGPRLVVFGRVRRRVGRGGASQQVLVDESRADVRVLHRIDQHQGVAEHRVDAGIALRRQQVIGLGQGRIGRGDLVAVHAVDQPHHDGQFREQPLGVGRRGPARVGEALQVGLDLFQPRDAIGAADHHQPQRPALPRAGVLDQPRARGRRLLQRLQVLRHALRRRDHLAVVVAEHGLDGGDRRVIRRAGP